MIMFLQPQLKQTKSFWNLFHSENIIDADSDDENEMDNAAAVPTSSELKNIMKKRDPLVTRKGSQTLPWVLEGTSENFPLVCCSEVLLINQGV
ncbi:hypothetical protein TNCV_2388621 [Trichonephila clavipes]|nr:hypothetical protein TNCV_2388621 [Trichonephila clavipes]